MHSPLPDFDELAALHRRDPAALEALRRNMLRDAVDEAPAQHRAALEQLLEKIEATRATAGTPMEAAAAAFRMMQESVVRLHDGWEQALEAVAGLQTTLVIERLQRNAALRAA
ncbi:DUF3135 domain-containing protein [Noviherbaspirillum sp.]|uniref:DUF3135 domain-containing protein n=1 Tax=Noviherbaspirillum sp. TaxID=1926288 RepID=UPI002D6524CA|nr:DUF3135 domain-containing protein [Noviherbaspirillum sp.]HZW22514.1 DUF3135 domain-containing protein [Noviherbaspirillum sp.]